MSSIHVGKGTMMMSKTPATTPDITRLEAEKLDRIKLIELPRRLEFQIAESRGSKYGAIS
jgi:hypothetical protein